jgi:two-component system phosphate regulon sensor histidine kinase PhoR
MAFSSQQTSMQRLLKGSNPLLLVLEKMRDGILLCDQDTKILLFNRSLKQLLFLSDEDLSRPCAQVIPEEPLQAAIELALQSGESVSEEVKVRCGTMIKSFQLDVIPLTLSLESDEVISGCMVVFHDITDIKTTEKMRRDFVANVSHELRTPLSAIKGYAETLLDGAMDDDAVRKDFIQVIFNHSLRLTALVQDLLDLSKLESLDFHPELTPTSLLPIIRRVRSMVVQNAELKNIGVTLEIPSDLPLVMANVSSLEQVFTNLLDNAIKYTPSGGTISMKAFAVESKGEKWIQVDISDTGIGIEAKHIPRLFERFYRVDKARSRDMGGTGLGLSIVKHIIQIHGGEIWVNSRIHHGSTFSFTLQQAT